MSRLRLLSIGALVWEQGFEHSLQAVALLRERGLECRYRIVGEGIHVRAVAFAIHELRLADAAVLVSPDGTLQSATELDSADVFVDAAVSDTAPADSLRRAHAASVPIVTTRPTLLPPGAAVAIPRRDPRALADALSALAAEIIS